jgi:ADP-ribose pyrophosphatase YjhB (NUDIX family)
MEPVESVAGAVFSPDRNSILLIQRRDVPVWALPGGGIEKNETPKEAIVREIFEETGFTVEVKRLVGTYIPINRLTRHTHVYECVILNGSALTSSETRAVEFFPLNALPKLIPPPYREWIMEATVITPPLYKTLSSVTYFVLIKNLFLHPILVIRFLLARIGLTINF